MKQNFVAFFMFGKSEALFSTKIYSSVNKMKAILFLSGVWLEINSSRISEAEHPIKLLEKHYPPPKCMLSFNIPDNNHNCSQ